MQYVVHKPYTLLSMKLYSIFLSLIIIPICCSALPYGKELEKLFLQLDSTIKHSNIYIDIKENKIRHLRSQKDKARTPEEHYWVNSMLYDEFYVHNIDSAMYYANENITISNKLHHDAEYDKWRIKKSFLLTLTGLLKEAQDVVSDIHGNDLPLDIRIAYYEQLIYLYSHFGQYLGDINKSLQNEYLQKEKVYIDSINKIIYPNHPSYYYFRAKNHLNDKKLPALTDTLRTMLACSSLEKHSDAKNAYTLAHLYENNGQRSNFLKYMIYSALADIHVSNKDIASLEELAQVVLEYGDIDRAYHYVNYCLKVAQEYPNRVRVLGLAPLQDKIFQALRERTQLQKKRMTSYLILVSVLSVILLCSIFYIYRQMKRLSQSRQQLNKANTLLNNHVVELSVTQQQLANMNSQLKVLNEKLKESNNRLRESNDIKEEYIGYVFSICSNYIDKLDNYKKIINRKIKARQFDELKSMIDSPTLTHAELKEFYRTFDLIFLRIYPDFIEDFNNLLLPGERIVLKEGELLNTELRIYAVVRLGINDSVKIAEFLHCSPQTVYNNRLKIRNRSSVPKEQFAQVVRLLGRNKV